MIRNGTLALLLTALSVIRVGGELLTRAERSAYQETSSYAEVMEFCRALTNRFASAQLISFGRTEGGRELPLIVLSEPGVSTPAEAGDKPVILCLGNIHGGEVCGKEALLMLARELVGDELLTQFVVLIAPIYNADGNEPFSTANRRNQRGPAGGVGQRGNGAGLDLNRDFMKLEALETRALVKVLRDWDPVLIIDTHTTNGSKHRYALTYGGPRHPAGAESIVEYARETFLPEVSRRVSAHSGYDTFFYGNFEDDHTRWVTYPARPRYGIHYLGLRHRLGILSEAYAYASFEERVSATLAFVRECLRVTVDRRGEILELLKAARRKANRPESGERVALRARLAPFAEKVSVKGMDAEGGEADYDVEYWGRSELVRDVVLPYAYLVSSRCATVLTNLLRHGIKVEVLRETLELEVQRYEVENVVHEPVPFQGHRLASWTVSAHTRQERLEAGTWVVRSAQPLGRLAAVLLEPESDDGLAAWSFFDDAASPGEIFPVARLIDPTPLLTAQMPATPDERTFGRRVDFEAVYGKERADFDGSTTRVLGWDDSHYLQERERVLHRVDPLTGQATPFFDSAKVEAVLQSLPEFDEATARSISRRIHFQMDAMNERALVEHDNDLYCFRLDGSEVARLTRTPEPEELWEFSPDGRWVSFIRGGNLHVVDLLSRAERALTTDGGVEVRNGKAVWIYYEEIYGRNWKAYWWSPDSRRIAFIRFDERHLPMFHALDTLPLHGRLESMRHPKPGDPNPEVRLGVVTAAGGTPRWANLDPYPGCLVVRVGWIPGREAMYVYVQDRAQTWLDFLVWDLKNRGLEKRFRETSPAWVDDPGKPLFWKDEVILLSDRTGWRHLFRVEKDRWTPLTEGEWEVRTVHGLDPEQEWIYFSGTRDSHVGENLYRCRPDGGGVERVTREGGHHQVSLSPEFDYVVDRWSDFHTPARVQLCRTDGTVLRMLDSNPVPALEEFELGESELVQILARDGFLFEGTLTRPPDFSPERKYPVWFMTYGGPQAPSVRDAWRSSQVFDQMLAAMGVVVFRMDPRSASGKGTQAAQANYRQLGVQELADVVEGIEWVTSKPYVDAARVGMSGHSYGGFMTAYALTHSRLFVAGIAGAPVTDWRYYDSIYTERYMNTPQENPDGYAKTSVVEAADQLHGRLLILHGMMDDNVHLQNTTALVQALQKAEKDFEVMFYPEMKHGLHGAHYHRLIVDFIRRSLGLGE